MKMSITKANGSLLEKQTKARNLQVFQGYIEGGFGGVPADGPDLDPGDAAASGSTEANGFKLNIRRGFVPSGGVSMTGWNLGVTGLDKNDQVDFELVKTTDARNNSNSNIYYQAWHDEGTPGSRIFDSAVLTKAIGGASDGELMNRLLPEKILPPQVRPVSDFIDSPQPIMVMSIVKNERSLQRQQSRRVALAALPPQRSRWWRGHVLAECDSP